VFFVNFVIYFYHKAYFVQIIGGERVHKKAVEYTTVYICTLVGAGFATGREIMVYFAKFGICGIFGMAVSILIFSLFIYFMLTNPPILNNRLLKVAVFVFNIAVFATMLAGANEVLPFGGIMTAVLVCMTVCGGFGAVSGLSVILLPIMLFSLFVFAFELKENSPPEIALNIDFLSFAFMYTAYNIITPSVIFDNIQTDKKTALVTALLSACILTIAMIMLFIPIYSNYEEIKNSALPIYSLCKVSYLKYVYMLLFLPAVFTTAVSTCRAAALPIKNRYSPFICTFTAYFLSLIGFKFLVDRIYFLFGIVGAVILLAMCKKRW
jgi:uncharacterized membrane protein YkvI